MGWGAAAAAIAGAAANMYGAHSANSMQAGESRRSRIFAHKENLRAYQRNLYMSNSAVTRRMADLKSAGINPILAGKYDASSPGASATVGGMSGQFQNVAGAITPSTAIDIQEAESRVDQIETQIVHDMLRNKMQAEHEWVRSWVESEIAYTYAESLAALSEEEARQRVRRLSAEADVAVRAGNISQSDFGVFTGWLREVMSAAFGDAPIKPR